MTGTSWQRAGYANALWGATGGASPKKVDATGERFVGHKNGDLSIKEVKSYAKDAKGLS
ncbi:MAG: hypothetical protein HRU34_12340 [Richelia sp.]|nr:hypothetical protein [Richelia sp.]